MTMLQLSATLQTPLALVISTVGTNYNRSAASTKMVRMRGPYPFMVNCLGGNMKKDTIKALFILGFTVLAIAVSAWAMSPVFPGFYESYIDQGFNPAMAFCYAVGSASQAARWVAIPLTLLVLPVAFTAKYVINRFGK